MVAQPADLQDVDSFSNLGQLVLAFFGFGVWCYRFLQLPNGIPGCCSFTLCLAKVSCIAFWKSRPGLIIKSQLDTGKAAGQDTKLLPVYQLEILHINFTSLSVLCVQKTGLGSSIREIWLSLCLIVIRLVQTSVYMSAVFYFIFFL